MQRYAGVLTFVLAAAAAGAGAAEGPVGLVIGHGDAAGSAVIRFRIAPLTARDVRVQGWHYTVCLSEGGSFEAAPGRSLAAAAAGQNPPLVTIVPFEGGASVDVRFPTDAARSGIALDELKDWEDLSLAYTCAAVTCLGAHISVCAGPQGGVGYFNVDDRNVALMTTGRESLNVCGVEPQLSVVPVFRQAGDIAVYLHAAVPPAGCGLQGWSYGVCFDGDIQVAAVRSGDDTFTVRNGAPPSWDFFSDSFERGIARSVVVDFMRVTLDPAALRDGWEDLVIELAGIPCGTVRICHREAGDPLVDAAWSYDENSLLMNPRAMGVRELCWRRGDTNFDNILNIADAVNLLSCLFTGGGLWCTCIDTACRQVFNVNADDRVNIADAVYLLAYIFAGGPAPPPLADTSY